ncbi:Txe/YoeB family addiction module toxin [Chlorobium ferrooxidans]|uniref:Txe/YoeB family addiction module toxin n=1 Tax=Chlorobium ferrooxidans TaxID=84205 RepID=UPI0018DC6E81|nr:Txe/YoeB family addiction module toxin [Chlorobium ferrooxidans]
MYTILFMNQAQRDAKKLGACGLKQKTLQLINIIRDDPYKYPPEFEYLKGDMKGLISRRINKQHRLVYEVIEETKTIKVYRMWTHYE